MTEFVIPTETKSAMYVVCLFLAQSGEPHEELGFDTQTAAFDAVGRIFGVPPNTVKNERDAFDNFTDSRRKGWQKDLAPRLQETFEVYSNKPRKWLETFAIKILGKEWTISMTETLPDLREAQIESRERALKIPLDLQYLPSAEVWQLVVDQYNSIRSTDVVNVVGRSTLVITTAKDNFLTISCQEIPRCWAVRPYVIAILAYAEKIDELAKALGYKSRSTGHAKNKIFNRLPSSNVKKSKEHVSSDDMDKIRHAVQNELNLDKDGQARFIKFLADGEWSGVSKTLERADWKNNAILATGGWLAAAADRRGELSIALSKSDRFEELMRNASSGTSDKSGSQYVFPTSMFSGGENVIYYGAPGTGKSNRVETTIKKAGKAPTRTVFHPDLQNSDFFGCLKPQMNGKKVSYKFSPGPFMEALAEAYSTLNEPAYLVIEELNRAAAAAVFGDLFLLLDRDDDGTGEYDVSFPSPESRAWFGDATGLNLDSIRLPSNLFIYATMNSADQGVYPIDTAFRRRWRQEYLPLDYAAGPKGNIGYTSTSDTLFELTWREFVEILNNYLASSQILSIAEDRLLGQWFVKEKELDSNNIPEKILLYLWDDLLRHEGRDLIFNTSTVKTYGALAKAMTANKRFLSDGFITKLDAVSRPMQEAPPESDDAKE